MQVNRRKTFSESLFSLFPSVPHCWSRSREPEELLRSGDGIVYGLLTGRRLARPDGQPYNPPMIAATEIEQMSLAQRMEAMELLWRSISTEPGSVVSPGWHGEVLQKRRAKIQAGKAEFLTVAQLKKRLGRRRR